MISGMKVNDTGLIVIGAGLLALTFAAKSHGKTPFDEIFDRVGKDFVFPIDSDFLRAIARTENDKLDPKAVSPPNHDGTRDYGLMQINQHTAKKLGVTEVSLLLDAETSIRLAATWLDMIRKELGHYLSPWTWASAYNVGSDNVIRNAGGITNPKYVATVMYHWQLYKLGKVV